MVEVETYEINEVVDEVTSDADSIALIEKMGLNGQQDLMSEDGVNICPYQQVNDEQSFIIASLCPQKYHVSEYSRGQIPLRVLQIISHVMDGNYFEEVQIWDKKDTTIKDPFLIGKKKRDANGYNYDYFLLARWGDELESWKELGKKAVGLQADHFQKFVNRCKTNMEIVLSNHKNSVFEGSFYESYSKPSLS